MILSKEKQTIFRHNCLRRSIINAMVRQVSRDSDNNILTSFEYTIGANGERTSVTELKMKSKIILMMLFFSILLFGCSGVSAINQKNQLQIIKL